MRPYVWALTGAVCGLAAGVVTTDLVWVRMDQWQVEGVVGLYLDEQAALASRAAREGDGHTAARHHLNAADAESGIGFSWVRWSRAEGWADRSMLSRLTFIPTMFQLDPYAATGPEYDRVHRQLAGQHTAQAALAFERAGESELAQAGWDRVLELHPAWSLEQHREFAERGQNAVGDAYERALLGSTSFDEFSAALASIREGLVKAESR